jgi:hypothetical protein
VLEQAEHDLWDVNCDYTYQEGTRITETGLVSAWGESPVRKTGLEQRMAQNLKNAL